MPSAREAWDAVALLAAALVGAAVASAMQRAARGRRAPREPDEPPPSSRVSVAVELTDIVFPLRPCWVCGAKIGKIREADRMWIRIEHDRIRYLHQVCADERGEPRARR